MMRWKGEQVAGGGPRVSVVICAHNYGHFLPQAVRSVRAQTVADWECIIVDDASTDATPEVARRLAAEDGRIRYARNERNLGVSASRNRGNAMAAAPWVAVLDADDWWEPTKLEQQLDALRMSGAVLCFTDYREVGASGERRIRFTADWFADIDRRLRQENRVHHSSVIISREAWHAVGGYDTSLPCAHDWDLYLKVLRKFGPHRIAWVGTSLSAYRVHGGGVSNWSAKMLADERRIVRRSLFTQGWALRHPIAALAVIDEQVGREMHRSGVAGALGRAAILGGVHAALAPGRRWRWTLALRRWRAWWNACKPEQPPKPA